MIIDTDICSSALNSSSPPMLRGADFMGSLYWSKDGSPSESCWNSKLAASFQPSVTSAASLRVEIRAARGSSERITATNELSNPSGFSNWACATRFISPRARSNTEAVSVEACSLRISVTIEPVYSG